MTEHRHHHHHNQDSASIFKYKSFKAIEQRKMIEKWLKITLIVMSIVMGIAVVAAYTIG